MGNRIWVESDKRLQTVLESNWFKQIVIVEKGRFVRMSDSFARMFGYTRQELIGMDALELLRTSYPIDPDWLEVAFQEGPVRLESEGKRKDGSIFYLEYWAARGLWKSPGDWFITSFSDITGRKREERAAKENEERFGTAFRYAAVGMALVGVSGRLLDVNYSMCEILGYHEDEMLEMTFQSFLAAEVVETYLEAITSLLIGETTCVELELKLHHKSGLPVWGNLNAALVRDDYGKPLHLILQLQNITKRKEAEELLRKSDKLNAVGQLAAGVAHEVRNPLTVLKGFTQMLWKSDPKKEDHYRLMLSEVERIEAIINEFLSLAKPQDTLFKEHDLFSILRDVAALMETKAIMNNVIIAHELEDRTMRMDCDHNQLKQVFINILQNAVEAMTAGGTVTLEVVEPDLTNEVIVRISDQGCGISEERIAQLGEPFYSSKERGTGLGLMICYQIIRKHQGRIAVRSKLNEGTVFDIILPVLQKGGSNG
jgi:PAS domain S-box-containing protein